MGVRQPLHLGEDADLSSLTVERLELVQEVDRFKSYYKVGARQPDVLKSNLRLLDVRL